MSQPYSSYRYFFPPRPEVKSPQSGLTTYERMGFVGQPKLNGSCAELYTNGSTDIKLMNRHQESFVRQLIPPQDLLALHKSNGYQVLVGEYMNKSKKDGKGNLFNGCLVLFDILVHNGQYLTGTKFMERQELMASLFPGNDYDNYLTQVSNNVFKVKNFKTGFVPLYNEIVKIDMYEGLVLKRPDGILEAGFRPANNTGWMVKIRKETKNYTY